MKEIKRTVTSTTEVTEYQALDGTTFSNRNECEQYEKSARGVLSIFYSKLIKGTIDEYQFFRGSSDNSIDIIQLTTEEEKRNLLHMICYINGYKDETSFPKEWLEEIDSALQGRDFLFIEWNYDKDWMWLIGSRGSLINKINSYCQ